MGSSDAEKSEEFKSPYSIVITKKKKLKKSARCSWLGVVNSKWETLRDGEISAFLCEPETY